MTANAFLRLITPILWGRLPANSSSERGNHSPFHSLYPRVHRERWWQSFPSNPCEARTKTSGAKEMTSCLVKKRQKITEYSIPRCSPRFLRLAAFKASWKNRRHRFRKPASVVSRWQRTDSVTAFSETSKVRNASVYSTIRWWYPPIDLRPNNGASPR